MFNFDTGPLFGEVKIHSFIDQVDFTKTKKQVMAIGHRYSAGAGCGLDVAVQYMARFEKVQISCLAACVECRYCRELLQMLINSFQMSQLRDERGCRLQKPELQSDTVGNLFSR